MNEENLLDQSSSPNIWHLVLQPVCQAENDLEKWIDDQRPGGHSVAAVMERITRAVQATDCDAIRSSLLVALASKAFALFDSQPADARALYEEFQALQKVFPAHAAAINGALDLYYKFRNTAYGVGGILPPPAPAAIIVTPATPAQHADIPAGYEYRAGPFQGGMGKVFKVHDPRIGRDIALKLIRPGKGGADQVRQALFDQEIRAMGALRHPNIVQIHSVGTHHELPFFTMDWIEGGDLNHHLTELSKGGKRLAELEVARIGKTVAEALQYAHEQGRRHRDLKPQNILLDLNKQPVICDFGLATVISAVADGGVQLDLAGTYAYMSPEQAAGPLDTDAQRKSDIFSLGATLFHLALGKTIYTTEKRDPVELRREVAGGQFPRAAQSRKPKLHPDLAAIIDRCLAFSPEDRYAKASDVAEDLNNFLMNRPVAARQLNTLQKLQRRIVNNPILSTVISGIGVTITSLLVVMTWLYFAQVTATNAAHAATTQAAASAAVAKISAEREKEARLEADVNRRNAETNALAAENNAAAAETNAAAAEANFQQAQTAINRFVELVTSNEVLGEQRFRALRDKLLSDALEYTQRFIELNKNNPNSQRELAQAFLELGRINGSTGSTPAAKDAYESALQCLTTLKSPGLKDREQIAILHSRLGQIQHRLGERPAAVVSFLKNHETLEALIAEDPPNKSTYRRLQAEALHSRGHLEREHSKEEALKLFQTAADHFQSLGDDRDLRAKRARCLNEVASMRGDLGQLAEAEQALNDAHFIMAELAESAPAGSQEKARLVDDLAIILGSLGHLALKQGDAASAVARWQEALEIRDAAAKFNPFDWKGQRDLAILCDALGGEAAESGQLTRAREYLQRALEIRQNLVQQQPQEQQHRCDLSLSHNHLGSLYSRHEMFDKARQEYLAAIEIQRKLVASAGTVRKYQQDLASSLNNLGNMDLDSTDPVHIMQTQTNLHEACDLYRALVKAAPNDLHCRGALGHVVGNLSIWYAKHPEHDDGDRAESFLQEQLVIRKNLCDEHPTNLTYQAQYAQSVYNLGYRRLAKDQAQPAELHLRAALELQTMLTHRLPSSPRVFRQLAMTCDVLGDALAKLGRRKDAVAMSEQAVAAIDEAIRLSPDDPLLPKMRKDYLTYLAEHRKALEGEKGGTK